MPKRRYGKATQRKTKKKVSAARARHARERGTDVPLAQLARMTDAQAKEYVRRSRWKDQP